MKKIILVVIVVVLFAGAAFYITSPFVSSENEQSQLNRQTSIQEKSAISGTRHKMVLRENGYQPQDITIKRGDAIEFSTSLDRPFWPASNIHPTHGIYPEFDPQDAVAAEKTWSFQFNKGGKWNYHDHLAPYHTGTITVEE